jgi:hypothetical protein
MNLPGREHSDYSGGSGIYNNNVDTDGSLHRLHAEQRASPYGTGRIGHSGGLFKPETACSRFRAGHRKGRPVLALSGCASRYSRARFYLSELYAKIIGISSGSGEWDAKMKDVMYPHNFPEDEALTLLRSMGEETLKTKILEQIDWSFSKFKDKTIEVFFYGIDIATYQNGEITLKL